MGVVLEELKEETVKTKWITAEIDRITALVYFIVVISVFIFTILLYQDFLQKFAQVFQNNELTKLVIVILSFAALGFVSYMFKRRYDGLKGKAYTVFRYLAALEAIKEDRENFKASFEDIERRLDNNDWTMAEYLVKDVREDYQEVFVEKVKAEKLEPAGVL
jgi:hypothetical protein